MAALTTHRPRPAPRAMALAPSQLTKEKPFVWAVIMLNPTMASVFLSKIGTDDHAEYRRLEKGQSFTEKIFETFHKSSDTTESRLQRRRSFTEKILETFQKSPDRTNSRLQRRLSYTEKILAIQSATLPGRPAVLPPVDTPASPKLSVRIRVRVQCYRHFLQGFEKLEPTGKQTAERRHALAQKLIAKTLRRADQSRRRRHLVLFRKVRRKMTLSPLVGWLQEPLVRLARIASLAAAKVEIHQSRRQSARVTCVPLDKLPLLASN